MDDFNKATALLLNKLYEAFPVRMPLRTSMFADEADAHMLQIYGETLIFLAREGFIRHEGWSTSEPIFFEAVSLTGKGIEHMMHLTPVAPFAVVRRGVR